MEYCKAYAMFTMADVGFADAPAAVSECVPARVSGMGGAVTVAVREE